MNKPVMILVLSLALVWTGLACGGDDDSNKVDAQIGVSALASLADSHLSTYITSFEALALTQGVQSGEWDNMKDLLAQIAPETEAALWYVLPDGSYYTVEDGMASANLSDRGYFPGLMSGQTVDGALVVSKSTGRKSAIMAVPVMNGNRVAGALGASVFLDTLSNTLRQELDLPSDMMFYAVDAENEVALYSDTTMILEEDPDLPENVATRTSSLTGWRFGLGSK